ncbi:hypothetical protein BCR42DRAFT_427312 [Absidia repens]|uniref:Uncharacterized protein n=1 Tax=Absidia repens TaxID=90262 RepID=A0A1X2HZQ7_9FUNG|nr:hypothetical protein BCR42DRAFT_427312 [Absidia repens]
MKWMVLFFVMTTTLGPAQGLHGNMGPSQGGGVTDILSNVPPPVPNQNGSPPLLVTYEGHPQPDYVAYGQCFPARKDGKLITSGRAAQLTSCITYADTTCTQIKAPVTFPLPPAVDTDNVLGLFTVGGQSFVCHPVTLKSILDHPQHLKEKPAPAVP